MTPAHAALVLAGQLVAAWWQPALIVACGWGGWLVRHAFRRSSARIDTHVMATVDEAERHTLRRVEEPWLPPCDLARAFEVCGSTGDPLDRLEHTYPQAQVRVYRQRNGRWERS